MCFTSNDTSQLNTDEQLARYSAESSGFKGNIACFSRDMRSGVQSARYLMLGFYKREGMECSSPKLNILREHCEKLLAFCRNTSQYSLDESDHIGFMSLCFLSKQIDHMEGVLRLLPHPDIQLISRTMIEGLSQLLWCFKDTERAFKWRGYAWINDWRVSRQMINTRLSESTNHAKNIEKFITDHGELFKIKKFKNMPIPESEDPFHKNWRCGQSLKTITEDVKGEELYEMLYSPYSDWQHWGVSSISKMIKRNADGVTYGGDTDSGEVCSSLAVAFQCLYQVMELTNSHHQLGMDNMLGNLRDEYISIHQT